MHKGDEWQLVGPAQPSHWKVLSSSGSEATVPSVCFLVPPPNQEAQEAVVRLEAQHQDLVALWHQLHVDMKSLLAWQSLSRDVQLIRSWSLVTVWPPRVDLRVGTGGGFLQAQATHA